MHSTINQLRIQLISVILDLFFRKNVEKLHFGFRGGKNIFGFRVLRDDVTRLPGQWIYDQQLDKSSCSTEACGEWSECKIPAGFKGWFCKYVTKMAKNDLI